QAFTEEFQSRLGGRRGGEVILLIGIHSDVVQLLDPIGISDVDVVPLYQPPPESRLGILDGPIWLPVLRKDKLVRKTLRAALLIPEPRQRPAGKCLRGLESNQIGNRRRQISQTDWLGDDVAARDATGIDDHEGNSRLR